MAYYTRQARRSSLCVRIVQRHGGGRASSRRWVALAAEGEELARVAARIAKELELSAQMADLLLNSSPQRPARLTPRRGRP